MQTCDPGFWDIDPEVPGCEYRCTPTSPNDEVCDGVDNNCSGLVDENDPTLVTPECENRTGVCADARRPCANGTLGACTDDDYAKYAPGTYEPALEVSCDGLDNNCDDKVDEHCCRAAEPHFVIQPDSGQRTVAGIWNAHGELKLALVDAQEHTLELQTIGTFQGEELTETTSNLACGGTPAGVQYLPEQHALMAACNSERASVAHYDAHRQELTTALETSALESATQLDVSVFEDIVATLVQTVDLSGNWHSRIISQGRTGTHSAEFAPEGKPRRTVALAAIRNELLVAYPVRTDASVWLQSLDRELNPIGEPNALVDDLVWNTSEPNAIAAIGLDAQSAVFAISENPSTLRVFLWDHDARTSTELATLEAEHPTRLTLQRVEDNLLIGAVVDAGLTAWELRLDGTVLHEWRFRAGEVTRQSGDHTLPARFSITAQHGVLYLAYATPLDLSDARTGVFIHRLGGDAAPLCR